MASAFIATSSGSWSSRVSGSTAGDLVAVEGKIFFIDHDKRVHNDYWSGSRRDDVPLSAGAQAATKGCISAYYY
jgi:hypothetical protein